MNGRSQIGPQMGLYLLGQSQRLQEILFAKPIGKKPAVKMQLLGQRGARINDAVLMRQTRIQQNRATERRGLGEIFRHTAANGIQQKSRL